MPGDVCGRLGSTFELAVGAFAGAFPTAECSTRETAVVTPLSQTQARLQ